MVFMNPHEGRAVRGADRAQRQAELSPLLRQAHEKARAALAARAINPIQFRGIYDDQSLAADKKQTDALRRRFEAQEDSDKKLARIFEALACDPATLGWFGRDGRATKTAEYDDFLNGVDLVVSFGGHGKPRGSLAAAVDLTFGPTTIDKKLQRVRDSIRAGESARVRYFAPSPEGKPGLSGLPRAVLGVQYETLAELARLWVLGKTAELHEHPVQRIIADELYTEMRGYHALAREIGHPELVASYEKALAFAHDLYNQKAHLRFKNGEDEDQVLAAIKKNLAMP